MSRMGFAAASAPHHQQPLGPEGQRFAAGQSTRPSKHTEMTILCGSPWRSHHSEWSAESAISSASGDVVVVSCVSASSHCFKLAKARIPGEDEQPAGPMCGAAGASEVRSR